ncbi:MAG: DUF3108 domain-containing protein [Acidobacteriota bacterium]
MESIHRVYNNMVDSYHKIISLKFFIILFFTVRAFSQFPFQPGEKMKYEISWTFLKAGIAEFYMEKAKNPNPEMFHIVLKAKSIGIISSFFFVDDHIESFVDFHSFCSHKAIKHQREGRWVSDEISEFDYDNSKIYFKQNKITKRGLEKNDLTYELGFPCIQDVLSCFYYFRILPLKIDAFYEIPVFDRKRKSIVKVRVKEKESIKTPFGEFDCFVLEILSGLRGSFQTSKGKLFIWITEDEKRIPVRFKSSFTIGYSVAELIEYQEGNKINE